VEIIFFSISGGVMRLLRCAAHLNRLNETDYFIAEKKMKLKLFLEITVCLCVPILSILLVSIL
jgi:hypothetical protein